MISYKKDWFRIFRWFNIIKKNSHGYTFFGVKINNYYFFDNCGMVNENTISSSEKKLKTADCFTHIFNLFFNYSKIYNLCLIQNLTYQI